MFSQPSSSGFTILNPNSNPKLSSHHHYVPSLNPNTSSSKTQPYVKFRYSEHFEQQHQKFTPKNSSFSPPATGSSAPRVFVGHSIYKGKAALTVEPLPPEFTPLDSGAFKLSKEGSVLLQFAPAASIRQYDWSRKQVFSLSVTEVGTLMSLGAKDSCEFFHDPNKGRSDEGRVRKVLKVEPLPDGSGHFFNLSVQNKLINMDGGVYIPITKAEYTVLNSAFNVKWCENSNCRVSVDVKVEVYQCRFPICICISCLYHRLEERFLSRTGSVDFGMNFGHKTSSSLLGQALKQKFIVPYLLGWHTGWHTFANSIKPEVTNCGNNANPLVLLLNGADSCW